MIIEHTYMNDVTVLCPNGENSIVHPFWQKWEWVQGGEFQRLLNFSRVRVIY